MPGCSSSIHKPRNTFLMACSAKSVVPDQWLLPCGIVIFIKLESVIGIGTLFLWSINSCANKNSGSSLNFLSFSCAFNMTTLKLWLGANISTNSSRALVKVNFISIFGGRRSGWWAKFVGTLQYSCQVAPPRTLSRLSSMPWLKTALKAGIGSKAKGLSRSPGGSKYHQNQTVNHWHLAQNSKVLRLMHHNETKPE